MSSRLSDNDTLILSRRVAATQLGTGPARPPGACMIEDVTDLLPQDAVDLAEDARRLLVELDREVPGASTAAGECRPPIDVLETSEALEVLVDVPGVPASSLRVAVRRDTVLVVGAKLASGTDSRARFHVAERSYGRFARAVRLGSAVDASRARAVMASGQLHVILPRIADRRGRIIHVPVERG
jgi:HSP20 family protein